MRNNDTRDYREVVGRGQAVGAQGWSQIGYNVDVGTSSETVWTVGAEYTWPVAAQQMELVSSGAQDTGAGTGIQQVQVFYLDASFAEKSVIITMAGAAAVPTVVADIFRVQTLHAYRFGGNYVAAGNIDIRTLGGGTIYGRISQGNTRSRDCRWTVPAGKRIYISSITLSTGSPAGGKNVLFTTRATYDDANAVVLPPNCFMPYSEILLQDAAFRRPLDRPTTFPTGVDLKVSALSDSAGAVCTAGLRGYTIAVTA
jgi:hypothetical protein